MNILVLGAGGMAGHVVAIYLREQGHLVDTVSGRNPLDKNTKLIDVLQKEKFEEFLHSKEYDIVVNCIGLLVQKSEERNDLASYLNSYLPHFLENYYKATKTRVIHLSTDCVFSGKNAPYKDSDPYDGESYYDRSKALGEIINDKDLTFRMSIIGPDMQKSGVGLFNWFYAQSGEISGYTKAIWNGITTIELARAINEAINQNLRGLYQLVPNNSISKFDLLKLFAEVFDREDINIKPTDSVQLNKTLICSEGEFNFTVPDYRTLITEMKEWIKNHSELYPHYLTKGSIL